MRDSQDTPKIVESQDIIDLSYSPGEALFK